MKNLIRLLLFIISAYILSACVGWEHSDSSGAGASSESHYKGLGIIAIENHARNSK